MSFLAYAGNFALDTSTGTQAITGVGFQPKAVIFLPTGATANGAAEDLLYGIGVATAADNRWSVFGSSEGGQSTTDTSKGNKTDHCAYVAVPGSSSVNWSFDLDSMDADGFTIDITDAPSSAERCGFIAIGGADLLEVYAGYFAGTDSTGTQAITGVGFKPDAILFASPSIAALDSDWAGLCFSVGFTSGVGEDAATGIASEDGETIVSDAARRQTTSSCVFLISNSGSISAEAHLDSFNADGFTIDWTNATGDEEYTFFLALRGGQYKVGSLNTQTDLGVFAETGVGFKGSGIIVTGFCNATSSSEIAGIRHSLGVATSSTQRFGVSAMEEDAQATSDCDHGTRDNMLYTEYNYSRTGVSQLDFETWEDDGFTLDQAQADPSAKEVLYFVMGSDVVSRRVFITHT